MSHLLIAIALLAGPRRDTVQEVMKEAISGERDGGLDVSRLPFTPETIKLVVMASQPRIQGCYEDHLALKPQKKPPQGTLKTRFTITPDGFVKGARVVGSSTGLKDRQLHDCVVAVLSSMEFPKPPSHKPQPIEFPFNLKVQR